MDKHVTIKLFNDAASTRLEASFAKRGTQEWERWIFWQISAFLCWCRLLGDASEPNPGFSFSKKHLWCLAVVFSWKVLIEIRKYVWDWSWDTGREEAFKDLKLVAAKCVSQGGGWGAALYFGQTVFRIYIFIVCLSKTGYTSLCQQRFSLEKIFYKM